MQVRERLWSRVRMVVLYKTLILRRRRLKVSLIRERILLVLRQTVTLLPMVFRQLAILLPVVFLQLVILLPVVFLQLAILLPVVFLQLAILFLNRHLTKHSNLLLLLSPLLLIQLLTQLEVRQMQRPRRDQHLPPIR